MDYQKLNRSNVLVKNLFLFGILAALSMSQVYAAAWSTCSGNGITWSSGWTNMYISTTSMPPSSTLDARLQSTMYNWNQIGGSKFLFYVGRDTDGSHSKSNGKNEIYFEGDNGALAVTYIRRKCHWFFGWRYGIEEADIGFNALTYDWDTGQYTGSDVGNEVNFGLTASHELGHALGLLHDDSKMGTMDTYYPFGGPIGYYREVDMHGDDRYGARRLYSNGSSRRDVSVSAYRRAGSGTAIANSSPGIVARGTNFTTNYTVENLGTQSESAHVRFYLSTNSYISTYDTYLGSITLGMLPGTLVTAQKTLYVPTSLNAGTYYVGYIVDPVNTIPEAEETNNFVANNRTMSVY